MGDSRGIIPSHIQDENRRATKQRQNADARARAMHSGSPEEGEEFECNFEGKFTRETEAELAALQVEHGYVTAGGIYQLVQEDKGLVCVELTGPEPALQALGAVGAIVVVRPYAFRSVESVKKKDPTTGEWVETHQDVRTSFKCRSIVVPTAGGFAIRFKYNPMRKCIVVC